MVYSRNQPVGTDDLDISQPFLTTNTNAADDSFGVDHYKFSDLTVNNGFHNKVTTPPFIDSPPTGAPPVTVANPVFYGFQQTASLGVLQYSRGPNNAVPSPLTTLQAPVAGIVFGVGATTNVFDFTGLPGVLAVLYSGSMNGGVGVKGGGLAMIVWNGANITITANTFSGGITAQAAGNILQLKNTSGSDLTPLVWTLQFLRIS